MGPEEKEVLPGVFMVDFRVFSSTTTITTEPQPELLIAEIQRLQNSINHLQRSNIELEEALKETPGDEDFISAIEENRQVIAKYEGIIAKLKEKLPVH